MNMKLPFYQRFHVKFSINVPDEDERIAEFSDLHIGVGSIQKGLTE